MVTALLMMLVTVKTPVEVSNEMPRRVASRGVGTTRMAMSDAAFVKIMNFLITRN